jgi:putative membrane protein
MSAIDEGIVREYFEQNGFLVRQVRKYQVTARRKSGDEEIDLAFAALPAFPSMGPFHVHKRTPAEVWGEAMGDMLAEIRKGRIAEGLAAGIRDVGFVLAEHFPRGEDDQNELPDRLIEV